MQVVGEMIRKRMQTYQDSIIEGNPNLCQLAYAVEESMAFLGESNKAIDMRFKVNRLWTQMDNPSSQKARLMAKQKLTKILTEKISYVNTALIRCFDIGEDDYDVFSRKYAPDVIMAVKQ